MSQPDRVVVPSETGEDTERVVYPNPETLVEIVEERATELANAEEPKCTEAHRWIFKRWKDRSASTKWSSGVPRPQTKWQRSLWTTGYRMRHVSRQS